jgi:NADP-dependent 3-hydroxy acid dehydrogenase YdfG
LSNISNKIKIDKVAVVTGASSGIGKSVSVELGRLGYKLVLLGRNMSGLKQTAKVASHKPEFAIPFQIDITRDNEVLALSDFLKNNLKSIDVLVHSAGLISLGGTQTASIDDFDRQYRVNARAPYLLTQTILPMIVACKGQIVFVNSSAGLKAGAVNTQYASTKHALKAIADGLRQEINPMGVRVISVYPGRTATPMQEKVYNFEGRIYQPESLLQPADVANIITSALTLPETAEVTEIHIRPKTKS